MNSDGKDSQRTTRTMDNEETTNASSRHGSRSLDKEISIRLTSDATDAVTETSPAPRSSVQFDPPVDTTSGNSSQTGFLRLAPPVQEDHQEAKAASSTTVAPTTFPLYGDGEMKVAARQDPDALRREEARELAYQEKMRLAQAHQPAKTNATDGSTKLPAKGSSDRKVAAVKASDPLSREEARELAYQEKMKLAQANPNRQAAQGSSRTALTLAPAADDSTHGTGNVSTDQKIEAFTPQDQSRAPPGPGIALSHSAREGWSSSLDVQSRASIKRDPDDEMRMAKRASAEIMKMQQQLPVLATSQPVMPQQDQRSSRTFEGEGLLLAPARAVSIETATAPTDDRPAPWREPSGQALLDEKRRMMEGSQGYGSETRFNNSIDLERGSGQRPSSSYLPTNIQINHNANRARPTQDLSLAKNMLLIDPRAAPLEHHTNAEEVSVIEAIAASSNPEELTTSHASTVSTNTDWVPPSRRMRTPAEGYTVRAGDKGPRDNAIAPGAIAVARRDGRAGGRTRANSDDSLDVLDSTMSYSETADGTGPSSYHSSRGDALSTNGVQGSENAASAWVASRNDSYSNQRAALYGSTFSSSSLDGKFGKRGPNITCIVFGVLVFVIALGTGLGVGLGGGNEEPLPSVETQAPTLPLNISFFQSLVEDFYEDGGTVFEDTNSPQYQALFWLASNPESETLDVGRIRTLYALAVFYYNTNGENFVSYPTWSEQFGFLNSTTENICKWNNGWNEGDETRDPKGLWCDAATESKIERLYLSSNNLNGAIPKEIGMLKDLQYLLVAYNRLVSTLPESLFELSALKGVDFNGNSISGTLPSTFVKATGLEVLHLGSNALRGPISLDHIVDNVFCPLTLVVLTGNTFSGTFPLERIAANCTDMTAININDAGLTVDGSIPPQGLEQLTLLDLTKSELAGSLPNEISRLWRLQEFKADFNTLTGTLPTTLGKLIALTDLSLSINNLEGTIPSELGQLQQLTSLVLSSNILSGTVPSELASCTKLVEVKLEMNTLSGDMDMLCSLSLERLTSDCDTRDIVCSCCSECY